MRIKLRHRLQFSFADPSRGLTQVLRLTPRSHEGQRINNWRIDVSPDCRLKVGEDHLGNITHALSIPGLVSELVITVQGEISTYDAVGIVRGTAERLPTEIYLRTTALTAPDPTIRALAQECAAQSDDRIGKLHVLMGAVHERVVTDPALPTAASAGAAFGEGRGNAEDHAHIFIAAARHLGWPARCVTGYFIPEEGRSTRHCWAEVQVEGFGWIGFDPVNDLCPQDAHIRTAIGLDAIDAAGIRGVRLEQPQEKLDVSWLLARSPSNGQAQSQRDG